MLIACSERLFAQYNTSILVTDVEGIGIEYANILIRCPEDSTILYTSATDSSGVCKLNAIKDTSLVIVEVFCLGYEEYRQSWDIRKSINITLEKTEYALEGATVIGDRQIYRRNGNSVIMSIDNTIFARQDKVKDVIKYLPFVTVSDNSIYVSGSESILIYVNGHKMRNDQYLETVSASDVKEIEVITSPGAEYDATVEGVIKIITKKNLEDGFSGNISGNVFEMNGRISEVVSSNLNYRIGKWDIFDMIDINDMRIKGNAEQQYQLQDSLLIQQHSSSNNLDDRMFVQNVIGFDYEGDNGVSFGAQYLYFREPKDCNLINNNLDLYFGQDSIQKLSSSGNTDRQYYKHQVDSYLKIDFSGTSTLGIDLSYDSGHDITDQSVTEDYVNAASRVFDMWSDYNHSLFAVKGKMEHNFSHSNLFYGAEYTNTAYQTNSTRMILSEFTDHQIITNDRNERNFSIFCGVDFNFEKVDFSLGTRYENASVHYCIKDSAEKDINFSDNHLFPNFSFSTEFGPVQFGISYTSKISRPRYYDLRNNVAYSTPLVCVGGNSELKSSLIHSISTDISYKDFQVLFEYEYQSAPIISTVSRYLGKPVILLSPKNLEKAQYLSASLYWSHKIKLWTPVISIDLCKPFLKYEGVSYDSPSSTVSLQNIIEIKNGWQLYLYGDVNIGGHDDLKLYKTYGQLTAGFSKLMAKDKLQISLYYMDMFRTYRDIYSIVTDDISVYSDSISGMHNGICMSITYNFDSNRKRYQGSSAGSSEKGRL